jgi:lipoate-protein ligase A
MFLIINENTSPDFNLALEEYALTAMELEATILWRNSAAVIIGNNQNASEEINPDYTREHNIPVIRRQSGGGAVFHDLGNVNFTIIRDMRGGDFNNYALFTSPVLGYLETLGVHAELQGRNDLVLDGAKFCGNAQAVKGGRIMHHGCLLYSADFSRLSGALKPRGVKFESHGVKSVRKRVTNIIDHMENPIPVEEFFSGLADYFMKNTENIEVYALTPEDIEATEKLRREKYSTWEWNFGKSPPYNMERAARYEFGIVEARLTVLRGVIADIHIYGDFFGQRDKTELEALIRGVRHKRSDIIEAISARDVGEYIRGMTTEALADLIS